MADMRFRRLGDSGLNVSVVGIGCNNLGRKVDKGGTLAVVEAALDAGINLFDTADIYGEPQGGSEELLGTALATLGRRDDVIIATKFGHPVSDLGAPTWDAKGSRRYLQRAVEASLRRLRTDYIDLYQLHMPDPETPILETLSALDDLVRAGKVRYVGCSQFTGWQVADAAWTARTAHITPFISAQNEYSLLNRGVEAELLPACERFNLGVLPFFPLASGLLTGKYHRGEAAATGTRMSEGRWAPYFDAAPWDTIEKIREYAHARELSMLDVAIGGLLARPAVASVIAGATTPDQVRTNAAAARWTPSADDVAELDGVAR